MHPDAAARLALLQRSILQPADAPTATRALGRYLSAVGISERSVSWARDAVDAFGQVARVVAPLGVTPDALRDPKIRAAHAAAQESAWPDGDPGSLAPALWGEIMSAIGGMDRNRAWDRATAAWVGTLGKDRFAPNTVSGLLGTRVPSFATDAQLYAVMWVASTAFAEGRDPSWFRLAEPLFDAFCAGAERFWVLADRVVVTPRATGGA